MSYPNASVSQRVWRTIDGGQSWINITGSVLGNGKPWAIAHALGTNGGVYIGTSNGRVLYRNATMNDWMEYSDGLPVSGEALRLVPFYRDQKIRFASWNLGVWEAPLYEPTTMLVDFAAAQERFYCPGEAVHFVDHSVVPDGATYAWTFEGATPATSTAKYPTVVYNTTGSFNVSLTVTYNGQSLSKTKTQYISSIDGLSSPLMAQDFESGAIPSTWQFKHPTGGGFNWNISDQCSSFGNGTFSMKFDNYWVDAGGDHDQIWLDKFIVNGNAASLSFDVSYAQYGGQYSDTLAVVVSTDCGASWETLYIKGGDELATAPDNTDAFIPVAAEWRNESIALSNYEGQELIVAFENIGRYGNQIYVDNIQIVNPVSIDEQDEWALNLFPNPASHQVSISSNQDLSGWNWMLVDALGRKCPVAIETSSNKTIMLLDGLSAGWYSVVAVKDNMKWVKSFQKISHEK